MVLHHVALMDAKRIAQVKRSRSAWSRVEYRLMYVINVCEVAATMN